MLRQRTLRAARAPATAENARRVECSPGHGPGEVAAIPARRAFSRAVERFAEQHVSGWNRRSGTAVLVDPAAADDHVVLIEHDCLPGRDCRHRSVERELGAIAV